MPSELAHKLRKYIKHTDLSSLLINTLFEVVSIVINSGPFPIFGDDKRPTTGQRDLLGERRPGFT